MYRMCIYIDIHVCIEGSPRLHVHSMYIHVCIEGSPLSYSRGRMTALHSLSYYLLMVVNIYSWVKGLQENLRTEASLKVGRVP